MENDLFVEMRGSWVVVRSNMGGVHSGQLRDVNGRDVLLAGAIRAWSWAGALSASELAVQGPTSGKLAVETQLQVVGDCCEVILQSTDSREAWVAISKAGAA